MLVGCVCVCTYTCMRMHGLCRKRVHHSKDFVCPGGPCVWGKGLARLGLGVGPMTPQFC